MTKQRTTTLAHYLSETSPTELNTVISAITSASIKIRALIHTAGLTDIYGSSQTTNIHDEEAQKLDLIANTIIKETLLDTTVVSAIASEEEDTLCTPSVPPQKTRNYVVLIDPLDGSSNIDVNISVGTIFAIYDDIKENPLSSCLQPGRNQIAAGYILYGPATMLILTVKNGVIGFTYDPNHDTFIVSHPSIKIPDTHQYYSINEGNTYRLRPESLNFLTYAKSQHISSRYVGSLVADFHRNLFKGGIYLYPGLIEKPNGKLRLLYEGNPLALICEQAGGNATNGTDNILDITPKTLHQTTPLFIGNTALVQHINSRD